MTQTTMVKKILKGFYHPEGAERIGFITGDNIVIEVNNISSDPTGGSMVSAIDIIKATEEQAAWATWHTHPDQDSNLSGEDYRMFKVWKYLTHFIVGNDGVKAFKWDEKLQDIIEV